MSILTKEDRKRWRDGIEAAGDRAWASRKSIELALDTIDALERTIKDIEGATTMHQVETIIIAARAFGVIEEEAE